MLRTPALAIACLLAGPASAGPASPPPPPDGPPRAPGSGDARPSTTTPPPPSGTTAPTADRGSDDAAAEAEPVDLSRTWQYSRGSTPKPRYVRTDDQVEILPNPEGYYSGVSVEGNHVPPHPAPRIGAKPALLTWTGFERTAGGSRVFFEVSADVATRMTIRGDVVTLRMTNTRINVRNNARYLDLRWFRTPVRMVKVSRKGKDTLATIALKRSSVPQVSVLEGKAGYRLVVVAFEGESAPADVPEAPPPPP